MDRKQHWEEVYLSRSDTAVSWYQAHPELSLALIEATAVGKDRPIIDVGGGASRLIDFLLDAGYTNLSVLDISAAALAHARARLGQRAERVAWYEADVTTFQPARTFAAWHDRAVFHFLTDEEDRRKYVEVLKQVLMRDGHVIIATFGIGGPEKCSGLDIEQYDAPKISAVLGDEFVLRETREEMHHTPKDLLQKFAYFRFQRQ